MKRILIAVILAGILFFGATPSRAFDQFHGATPVPKLNYDSLFQAATPLEKSADGQALIARCMERYGGSAKLEGLKSLRLTYRMKAFLSRDSVDVTKCFEVGRRYKITNRASELHEMRILNGNRAWFLNADTTIELDSGRYKAEYFSYMTLAMPLALKTERFDDVRFGKRDPDSLSYVYMMKRDTMMAIIGIDPRDGLIKSSEGLIYQGDSHFAFINLFGDHRQVQGYTIPHLLTNISMGLEVARSVVTEVDINTNFGEDEFKPKDIINLREVH